MLQICRAEDGQVFQSNTNSRDIERVGSLEFFLQEETGVPQDAVLAYLSDGRRLTNGNIRDLAGVQDQTIYVFNKTYLDVDMDLVLRQVRIEATMQPPIEETLPATPPFKPSQLASSYLRTVQIHVDEIDNTLRSLRYQNEALRIASSSLDLNVLSIVDAFEAISATAQRELEKQAGLLSGLGADLDIVGRVTIHKDFMSPTVRKAIEAGEKGRTLGDYVSRVKMGQVAETCTRTHEELKERFAQAKDSMKQLQDGTDDVRTVVADTSPLDEADLCSRRSHESCQKLADLVAKVERPSPDSDKLLPEMRQIDASVRSDLQQITNVKNGFTERCISVLRQISILNDYLLKIPVTLNSLQASFRAKTSFSHIQRLHHMLYAYGATVIEVVRRKEFAQFFYQRAQSILEVMAKLSAGERKRRQIYRGEVHGQLPFEAKGMDDTVPTFDFSPIGNRELEPPYSLDRTDVDALLHVLDDLERFARESPDPAAMSSVKEARSGLEKLIGKMDNLESGFDRIAERSLLSSSRFLSHRRRTTEADEQVYAELEAQVLALTRQNSELEEASQSDRHALEDEIAHLRTALGDTDAVRDQLERDLHSVRALLESETTSRRILEQRKSDLSNEADSNRTRLATALTEATSRAKETEVLRQELARVRKEFEEVKALENRNAEKITSLLQEQANALQRLEEARSRGEDLEAQIASARTESDDVKQALAEASKEKDRLLRAQASEHDRLLRDHIAEADGDRAVLEHQYLELKAELEDTQRQLKDARAQTEMGESDGRGLRQELQRVEHDLREAKHAERVLRDDLRDGRASQSNYERRLENSGRLVAEILEVALRFRESHVKALSAAQNMSSHPSSSKSASSASMTDSSFGPVNLLTTLRRGTVNHMEEPPPIDPSDPAAALEILRAFDHDQFLEAINKTGSTIRKWQKQCKEYRERAKGKISFRNFAKGDLALFLPTRNSVSKPWAAFNVSFPHYFLQAAGHLAEQLKTREWVVARITSIAERVVDHKDASTNPYGLGDGVKYYMLEVEDWTQPTAQHPRRRGVNRKSTSEVPSSLPTPETPAGPPDTEIEDTFTVTHPPTSKHFPVPPRVTSPLPSGPSSLSRLLAQAPSTESPTIVASPEQYSTPLPFPSKDLTPPPASSPPPPPSPVLAGATSSPNFSSTPSTLRPGSRASTRVSASSKFSGGRIPFAGSSGVAKAVATTALTEEVLPSPPSTSSLSPSPTPPSIKSFNPSPEGSPTEGVTSLYSQTQSAAQRRRPLSLNYHAPPRNSPLATNLPTNSTSANLTAVGVQSANGRGTAATLNGTMFTGGTARSRLASLASGWGMTVPFTGRKKSLQLASPSTPDASDPIRSPTAGSDEEGS